MVKLVALVLAVLFLQVIAVVPRHIRNKDVQNLLTKIRSEGNDASTSFQNLKTNDHHHRRAFRHEGHEFAHHIHQVVHHLIQAIHHNHDGQGQETLKQIVRNLSDVVHNIQRSLNQDFNYVKDQIKTQIQRAVDEAEKIAVVAQQQQGSDEVNDDIGEALDDLLVAIQQLLVRICIYNKNQQELNSKLQTVTNEASTVIQRVSASSEDVVPRLAHYVHHLAHHIGEISHRLQREAHHHPREVRNSIYEIKSKLHQIRSSLEKVADNKHIQLDELKNGLKSNVHEIYRQLQKLVQVAYTTNIKERESHYLKDVVYSVVSHAFVAIRQLQRNIERVVLN